MRALTRTPADAELRRKWAGTLHFHALAEFDRLARPAIVDAPGRRTEAIVGARRLLGSVLAGYGKAGIAFFDLLELPSPGSEGAAA